MGELTPAQRFGKRVYATRTDRGWSMRDTGRAAGVNTSAVMRAERGDEIGLSTAVRIAGVLGISLYSLLQAPACQQCGDRPPAGFTCGACGTGGPP